jgi:YfiH family protein
MPSTERGHEAISIWSPARGVLPDAAYFGMARRRGGASRGAYSSLNLGLGVGDEEAAVLENRRRIRDLVGIPEDGPVRLYQVHGRALAVPQDGLVEADGFVLQAGDPWVAVSAADCAPVAIVSDDASRGALLHCGWRGARDRIAAHAVARLVAEGCAAATLRAAIGPCLMPCCFPVGPEVAAEFDARLLRAHPTGQPAIDLPEAIASALRDAGVPAGRVGRASECTSCDADSYYSHRRDRGVTGRHWAFLRLPLPAR